MVHAELTECHSAAANAMAFGKVAHGPHTQLIPGKDCPKLGHVGQVLCYLHARLKPRPEEGLLKLGGSMRLSMFLRV